MIVVGVDGSDGSRRALAWACQEAQLRGCAVEVVTAWTSDRQRAEELQRHVVEGVRRELESAPAISWEVVHGDAADALIRASAEADLLVVGNHAVSSLRHAGQESVSAACARLSECPCVVIPVPRPPRGHLGHEVVPVAADD